MSKNNTMQNSKGETLIREEIPVVPQVKPNPPMPAKDMLERLDMTMQEYLDLPAGARAKLAEQDAKLHRSAKTTKAWSSFQMVNTTGKRKGERDLHINLPSKILIQDGVPGLTIKGKLGGFGTSEIELTQEQRRLFFQFLTSIGLVFNENNVTQYWAEAPLIEVGKKADDKQVGTKDGKVATYSFEQAAALGRL